MSADVQYGPQVAAVYDWFISGNLPVEPTLDRLRPLLAGSRVLEIGVGTGRVALPAAALAAELVGVDNSPDMLDQLRAKGVPSNLTLVQADFRRPLPVSRPFDLAYATLGSLACVRSRAELTAAFGHVAATLAAGASLCLEYYSAPVYRQVAAAGPVTVPLPDASGSVTCAVDIDADDVLTIATRIETARAEPVEFGEQVLLVDAGEVQECLRRAGFDHLEVEAARELQPYDWHLARTPATQKGTPTCAPTTA